MYKIVELVCDIPFMPGQWVGRLEDGRGIYIRNDTFESEVRISQHGQTPREAVSGDRIYRGLAVEVDRVAVTVICANAGIELAVTGIEGVV